ncbi:unnamed protein product [Effrenium voratum]|nr:unnamed protein product [Effrenium voratum]
MAQDAMHVDDIAEEQDARAQDREQLRTVRSLELLRWDALLEEPSEPAASAASAPERSAPKAETGTEEVPTRRGIIRFLYLVVDMTQAAALARRLETLRKGCLTFAERLSNESPLSEMGLLALRQGGCETLAPLGSSPAQLRRCLDGAAKEGARGVCCAVSALQRALQGLDNAPTYGLREVLVLLASVGTNNLQDLTLEEVTPSLRAKGLRVSVVSLSPEIFVLRRLCEDTGGRFEVALDVQHFEDLLLKHLTAPSVGSGAVAPSLVRPWAKFGAFA